MARWRDSSLVRSGAETASQPVRSLHGRLRRVLSGAVRRPVLDHTGRYDLVVNWVDDPGHPGREGFVSSDDPEPLSHWGIDALGLRATPINIPAEALVIDHIERPSLSYFPKYGALRKFVPQDSPVKGDRENGEAVLPLD